MPSSVTLQSTLAAIAADAKRYRRWHAQPGFWVCLSYRIRRLRKLGPPVFKLLLPLDVILGSIKRLVSDTTIPARMEIGPGLYLPHPTGIILNPMALIGPHVSLFQQVTVGEWRGQAPRIGAHCAVFGGAKVFGGITIGDHCLIGANVVVNQDLPAHTSAAPAEPILRPHGNRQNAEQQPARRTQPSQATASSSRMT